MRNGMAGACALLALSLFVAGAALAGEAADESNWEKFKKGAKEAGGAAWSGTKNVAESVAEGAQKAGGAVARGARKTGEFVAEGYEEAKEYVKEKTSEDETLQHQPDYAHTPPAQREDIREALEPLETVEPPSR